MYLIIFFFCKSKVEKCLSTVSETLICVALVLILYHTIPTFNDLENEAF